MARAQALVLALTFQLCAPETETPAGKRESVGPSLPLQPAQYDDFQWEQVRIHPGHPGSSDLPHGEAYSQSPFPLHLLPGACYHLLCYLGYIYLIFLGPPSALASVMTQ
uniref:Uncharacterized protein n=1 Tax=Balaenoptera musculus TaxID=9771 RepID=A0A8C0CIP3_BALMU